MKKSILFIASVLIYTVTVAQNDYSRGFETGFKEGYCYNDFGCIAPITPITPIPNIGESQDNYQDGYNRGFKRGLEDKQTKKSNSGNSSNNNTYNPQPYVSTHVSPNFDLIMQAGAAMQARYDKNIEYRDNLIKWVFELKKQSNDQQFLNEMDSEYKKLRAMDDEDFGELGDALRKIKNDISYEIDQCNTRMDSKAKELPKKLWESGNSNMKKGNYSQAINDFSELIKLQPDFAGAYGNRGVSYQNIKSYALAIQDFSKVIELKPDQAYSYERRGWCKYYLKDNMGALTDFNKQIELEPASADAYYNRGSAKSELGDENGAITDYSKAIDLKPNFSMAYNNRGWAKFNLKKYNDAISDLDKAIFHDTNNWVAYDSRQETKFAANDLKGCIEDCNFAIALNPKCANSYLIRGRALYKQGNKIKACEDWSKAGELGKIDAYDFIQKYCK